LPLFLSSFPWSMSRQRRMTAWCLCSLLTCQDFHFLGRKTDETSFLKAWLG
jgi:hypothetical protein